MFREHGIKRQCPIYSKEKSEFEIYGNMPTPVLRHSDHLIILLKEYLLLHRYDEATSVMKALTQYLSQCPNIVKSGGIAVLRQSPDNYSDCVLYYKSLLARPYMPKKEGLLVELILLMASNDDTKDAVDVLESYLQSDPYQSNKLLQSYAGLFHYILWKREAEQGDQPAAAMSHETNQDSEVSSDSDSDFELEKGSSGMDCAGILLTLGSRSRAGQGRYVKAALSHWSLVLDRREGEELWHPFVREHVELLRHLGHDEQALRVVTTFADRNPDSLRLQKFSLEFIKKYHPSDTERIEKILRAIARIDDSASEVLELISILKNGNESSVREALAWQRAWKQYPHNALRSVPEWSRSPPLDDCSSLGSTCNL